ncbi:MAG: histidine--tRNA ligase [Treponema sp.]|jgi:histidyl-tRNA synthetase|nr:histidine--tRNA ligase [Treponema sp.]
MASIIEPKILKGFRDFLPPAEIIRRNLVEKIETACRSFGFVPIDTPALEYAEILLGKGGGETEKQIYRFTDNGGRDVALRFDLTVPFARFIALHQGEITLPFKRYHIAKVWRGENTQRGRYREFTQCDFDIVGSSGPAADFEILLLMRNTLLSLGAEANVRINHRGLFNRFLAHTGAAEKSVEILRAVDKLAKAGRDETVRTLTELAGPAGAEQILEFTAAGGSFDETLERMIRLSGGDSPESERLKTLRHYMIDSGTEASFVLDPSITRGLDYYTGVVFETFLTGLPDIGSVCSGGRYDDLAGLYSKENITGVGASIGLDRLIATLESLGKFPGGGASASAAIACVALEQSGRYQALAEKFRAAGIPCEVFLDETGEKQLVKQFILAEKKGVPWLIIPSGDPLDSPLTLRDLAARQNREGLSAEEICAIIRAQ